MNMISILKINTPLILKLFFVCVCSVFLTNYASANQTITITPTLFNAKVVPGQIWSSNIKVVNPNNYPLTIYAESVNFFSDDETGRPFFTPKLLNEAPQNTLAEWVVINSNAIVIQKGQSITLPFSIKIPNDAPPGGHYAAITVGTKPPEISRTDQSLVTASQVVASLLFIKVDGDIVEKSSIREFRAVKGITQSPENSFSLRVQNEGNVHIQPQGEISIYNMWDAKRGTIPINQQTQYGSVLKESIREFNFAWKSDSHPFDIGRYKAMVTLGYGDEDRQFITSTTYFWVIPYTVILTTVVILFSFGYFLSLMIRIYIRRVLSLSGIDPRSMRPLLRSNNNVKDLILLKSEKRNSGMTNQLHLNAKYKIFTISELVAPCRKLIHDIKALKDKIIHKELRRQSIIDFVITYKLLFITIVVLVVMILISYWFRSIVSSSNSNFEVVIDTGEEIVTLSSEELFYNTLEPNAIADDPLFTEQSSTISLVNTSGVVGTAAKLNRVLDGHGVVVSSLSADSSRVDKRTIIVYDRSVMDEAVQYSRFLNNAPVSLRTGEDNGTITIYVGQDYVQNESE